MSIVLLFVSVAASMFSGCIPRRETPAHVFKEKAFLSAVATRNATVGQALASRKFAFTPKSYYFLEPDYSCDVDLRVGDVVGDGAKFLCNPHFLREQSACLYYGFGVDGNILFEQALRNVVDCEMHTFDPTPAVVRGEQPRRLEELGVSFHPWGLSGSDGTINIKGAAVSAFTFNTIRKKLAHSDRVVDVLKIDIEGFEWACFDDMFRDCNNSHPLAHQILVELHDATQERVEALYQKLLRCGYRTFHKDPNLFTPHCMEYAFVHWRFLKCANAGL